MTGPSALDDTPEPELHDSGYTSGELDAIFDDLAKGQKFDSDEGVGSAFGCALMLGIADGDVVPLTERETVMLSTPRDELDRRVAAIREKLRQGMTLGDAVDEVCA